MHDETRTLLYEDTLSACTNVQHHVALLAAGVADPAGQVISSDQGILPQVLQEVRALKANIPKQVGVACNMAVFAAMQVFSSKLDATADALDQLQQRVPAGRQTAATAVPCCTAGVFNDPIVTVAAAAPHGAPPVVVPLPPVVPPTTLASLVCCSACVLRPVCQTHQA